MPCPADLTPRRDPPGHVSVYEQQPRVARPPRLEHAVRLGGEVMLVTAQQCLHVTLVNLGDEDEEIGSAVGARQADLAHHDLVGSTRRDAQRPRLREPRFYS